MRALGPPKPTTPTTTNASPLLQELSKRFVSIHLPGVFNPSLAQLVSASAVYLGWSPSRICGRPQIRLLAQPLGID